ncbi:hypothetical protein GE09DRAFT_1218219 [Coniochaeta sp. 2T2.1]|nr:hypothetical protein GE09DRAFT_1218219 [Coniochaeta sp. 2T2.1]
MARQTNNSQSVEMDIFTPPSSTGTTSPSTTKKAPAAKKTPAKKTPAKKTSKSPPKEVKPGTAVRVKRKRGWKNGNDDEEDEQLTGKAYWAKILGPGLYGADDSEDDNNNDDKAPPAKRARTATPPPPEPVNRAGEVSSVDENQPLAAAEPEKAGTPQPTPLPATNPMTPNKHNGGETTFPVHLPTPTSLPRKETTAQASTEPTPSTATKQATKQAKKPAKPRAPRKPKAEPQVKPKPKAPPKPRAPRKPKEPKEPKAAPKPKAPRKPRATKGQGKGKQAATTTTLPPGIPANAKEVAPGQWEVTLSPEEEAAFLADPMAEGIIVEYGDEEVEVEGWYYDPDSPIPSVEGDADPEDPEVEFVELVDIRPARRTNVIPNVVEKLRRARAELRGQVEEVERENVEATWWCKWKDLGDSESEDEEDDDIIEEKETRGRGGRGDDCARG